MEEHIWLVSPESTIQYPMLTWFKDWEILDILDVTWWLACDSMFTLLKDAPVSKRT